MNIQAILSEKLTQAFISVGISSDYEPQVRQSTKIQFGDYQVNGIMSTAKKLSILPQQLAQKVLKHLDLIGIARKTEIVGPGFINIFLDPIFLANHIDAAIKSTRLGVSLPKSQTVVVDYSSPNIAKEMHVGHLRSTIIGDATVRTLEFLGHKVIRANHVGDWGTQFGMLIAYLEKKQKKNDDKIELSDLETFYREAKKHYDEDEAFSLLSRNYVVKLQSGDPFCLRMWKKLVDISMSQNQITYNRLNVTLTPDNVMGESLYNSMLPGIVADLKKKKIAIESKSATVVFLEEYTNTKGDPLAVIIQKNDGGYLYSTTDIACANYRYKILHADRILYYTDSRQYQHLTQVWTIAKKAGYIPDTVQLEHHMFGLMLDKDGKPFKTRTGSTIKLSNLLDEALIRARRLIKEKKPNISTEELEKLSNVIGIGALKYADLSKNRIRDYIFDWDKMLSFQGNTAPYIQYAYTRILSIFRKADIDDTLLEMENSKIILCKNHEFQLAVRLLQFEEILSIVARDGTPHVMCSYLYDLATKFSVFYEQCPILSTKNTVERNSRLKLAKLTAKTLKLGLDTLGIETVERM